MKKSNFKFLNSQGRNKKKKREKRMKKNSKKIDCVNKDKKWIWNIREKLKKRKTSMKNFKRQT